MSNWKRFLILALTVSVLSSTLIFSASADELNNFYDVLQVASANGNNTNQVFFADAGYTVYFDLPIQFSYYGAEGVIRLANDSSFKIELVNASGTVFGTAEYVSIGNNLWRFWVDGLNLSQDLRLKFTTTSSNVSFLSLHLQTAPMLYYADIGAIMLSTPYQSNRVEMVDSNTAAVINFLNVGDDVGSVQNQGSFIYSSSIVVLNWAKYDYVTIQFRARSTTLDSIVVRHGSTSAGTAQNVPFTYSFINGSLPDYDDYDGSEDVNGVASVRWVNLTLDLSNVDRSLDDYVYIDFTGTQTHYTTGFVSLVSVNGYVNTKLPNNELFFLARIWDSLKTGFQNVLSGVSALGDRLVGQLTSFETNITNWIYTISNKITNLHNDLIEWFDRDTAANDQLDQDLSDQESELGDISDSFESVTQPTITDEQISIEQGVNNVSLTTITNWTTTIFGNSWFFAVFNMSMIFSLASLILFGKR